MPGYDYKAIKGYAYDKEKAKQMLTEAGYPDGKGLGEITLQINDGGGRNSQVAEAIQSMLKEVGITMKLNQIPFAQHLDNIDAGRADFYRLGWIADYPDPENFLNLFYGKNVPSNPKDVSPINSFRYVNPEYDALLEAMAAMQPSPDDPAYMELYLKAIEIYLRDLIDAPIQQWLHRIPMNTTYWTNWPTAENNYVNGAFWHETVGLIFNNLQPAKA